MSEKKPIVKIAFFRPKESWYRLPAKERAEFWDKALEKWEEVGGRVLTPYCNCYWSNEEWPYCSIEQFPDIEALQKAEDWLMEQNWNLHVDSKLILGRPMNPEESLNLFAKQI